MDNPEFLFRWNKYDLDMVASLSAFYEQKKFSDVTIACEGTLFKAHRVVLAAVSSYFDMLFSEHQSEKQIVHMSNVSAEQMKFLMEFIYKGSIKVQASQIKSMIDLGQTLQIKVLSEFANSVKDFPLDHHFEDLIQQHQESLTNTPMNVPIAVTPSPSASESSSMMETTAEPKCGRMSYYAPYNHFRVGNKRPDAIEDQYAVDTTSSSADGYPSDSKTASLNQFNAHNGSRTIKRARTPGSTAAFSGYERPKPNFELGEPSSIKTETQSTGHQTLPNDLRITSNDSQRMGPGHMDIPPVAPGEKWFQGRLQFMLSQRGKPLLVHDGHSFGIQYIRKDKKYWQCNLSRKYNCKARVTTTDTGDIIVTNNEHCHTEIRQHLRKDYKTMKLAASLAASRASFAVSLALPTQLNPAIDCSSTTSMLYPTITMNDNHPASTTSGIPDAEQDIRSMNLSRVEQVQR